MQRALGLTQGLDAPDGRSTATVTPDLSADGGSRGEPSLRAAGWAQGRSAPVFVFRLECGDRARLRTASEVPAGTAGQPESIRAGQLTSDVPSPLR